MNQILMFEKYNVSPEIKRKRLIYKVNFFIALILIIILFSYYAYAEYSKYVEEEQAKQVLSSINFSIEEYDDTNVKLTKDSETVVLDDSKTETIEDPNKRTPEEDQAYKKAVNQTTKTTKSGDKYYTIGVIEIPKINLSYGILNKTTDEILKLSPTKFWGPDPNKIGNLCIVGHNYRNAKFFSKVPTLVNGDIIKITDVTGKTVEYEIYDMYVVEPENVSATSQKTNGKREITLITCTDDSVNRVIVKAREKQN